MRLQLEARRARRVELEKTTRKYSWLGGGGKERKRKRTEKAFEPNLDDTAETVIIERKKKHKTELQEIAVLKDMVQIHFEPNLDDAAEKEEDDRKSKATRDAISLDTVSVIIFLSWIQEMRLT